MEKQSNKTVKMDVNHKTNNNDLINKNRKVKVYIHIYIDR